MKEVYQSLTIDVIAKCAFGIEVNSLKPTGIDKTNKLYRSAIDVFAAFLLTNRWIGYFFIFAFYIFPDLTPASWTFPADTMDCKLSKSTKCYKLR